MNGKTHHSILNPRQVVGRSTVQITGPKQITGAGPIGLFGQGERKWESERNARLHTPYPGAGGYRIAHMRPCGADGKPLTSEQQKDFGIQHNGIKFPIGKDGTLRYLDTQAFEATIKDGLEWSTIYHASPHTFWEETRYARIFLDLDFWGFASQLTENRT